MVTRVGKDRPDIAIELDGWLGRQRRQRQRCRQASHAKKAANVAETISHSRGPWLGSKIRRAPTGGNWEMVIGYHRQRGISRGQVMRNCSKLPGSALSAKLP